MSLNPTKWTLAGYNISALRGAGPLNLFKIAFKFCVLVGVTSQNIYTRRTGRQAAWQG